MQHLRQVIYLPFLMLEAELYSCTSSNSDEFRKRADFILFSVSLRCELRIKSAGDGSSSKHFCVQILQTLFFRIGRFSISKVSEVRPPSPLSYLLDLDLYKGGCPSKNMSSSVPLYILNLPNQQNIIQDFEYKLIFQFQRLLAFEFK